MTEHIAVMAWGDDNRVAKFARYDLLADAQQHVADFSAIYPNAFVAEAPDEPVEHWLVDAQAHTLSVDVPVEDAQSRAAALLRQIDMRAQAERAKYCSTIWGQESVYLMKEGEAQAWQANSGVAAEEIPYLTAEAATTGKAVATLAGEILINAAQWRALSVLIEARRQGLKVAVGAALDEEAVEEKLFALDAIDVDAGWPE